MYVVDSSARKATITLTGEEVAVKFPCTYSVFGIKGDSMLLYPKSGMAQGDDGVYDTAEGDGSVIMCLHYQADTVYIKGTGDCVIWAGNSTLDNPFKATGKGGGGSGDNTHYKGTTTTAIENGSTTNPIVIDGEDYTAVFGDIVVYGYTEFVFDGTQWSEFGRPFDTTPTSGSANAVTSDGIYRRTPLSRGTGTNSIQGAACNASGNRSMAIGYSTTANRDDLVAIGSCNNPTAGDLFEIGNGTSGVNRSNIVEVNSTSLNVNGDIQQNGVPLRATTMPTITASMLGKVVQYVGETTNDYVKGYFYIASSDGAAEPTYSWVSMVDSTPTSGSKNFVTSDAIYGVTPFKRGATTATVGSAMSISGNSSVYGVVSLAYGLYASARGNYSVSFNYYTIADQLGMTAVGSCNSPRTGDLFNIGNGTDFNHRSNIVEVNSTSLNVNGDIQRDGVGIDDYTTTERKIGKWIDGSDLYQRTFEVTGLVNKQWNNSALGTSGINIVEPPSGTLHWLYNDVPDIITSLNYFRTTTEFVTTCIDTTAADVNILPSIPDSGYTVDKAVITIKYTKPSVQANVLNANIQQTEEPTDEMR